MLLMITSRPGANYGYGWTTHGRAHASQARRVASHTQVCATRSCSHSREAEAA